MMDSSLKLQIFCGIFALVIIFLKIRRGKSRKGAGMDLPEPSGALPIIGHLHKLGGGEPFFKVLGGMAEKNGPIFKLRFGMDTTLVISGWEVAKECFTTSNKALVNRPASSAVKYMFYENKFFPFTRYGPYWREMRKIVSNELLSPRRLEMLKHFRINEINMSIKSLYKKCVSTKPGEPFMVDMKIWFFDLMYNVVFTMVTGKRYFGSENAHDEIEARKYQAILIEALRFAKISALVDAFPFLNYFCIGDYRKGIDRVAKVIDGFCENLSFV
ncbi:hypothetical protein GIB67_025618 [Kingdonia uniflora]|uniref:Cytochrome P450 n=1 Tax=Kingdonia uniflora TaxID=39325 RepID=A0A7J7L8J3_9MAGN|nr:hypothetical protein GIB67_025618 [Kingdonia uniflora]